MKRLAPERGRIQRLRKIMRRRSMGLLLVSQRENVRYLSGFTGSAGVVLVSSDAVVLITDFRYKLQAERQVRGARVRIQKKDIVETVRETAEGLRLSHLCVDGSSLTMERAQQLRKKGLRIRTVTDPVAELRQRKDGTELNSIKLAVRRAEHAFRTLVRSIRPGFTERQIGLKLEYLMRDLGARRSAFDIIVASGPNGAMPHATLSERKLRKGDLVTIDFGAESDGYFCDITRTLCIGPPSPRQREIHALVLHAQEAAIRAIRPGTLCKAVDAAARDLIAAAGHGEHFGHATGHGVGLAVHEGPSLSSLSKAKLESGMVVTVEPGVYVPRWGGVRIEDMVFVGEEGGRLLTTLPREL
jgi:Xaa-Pro aminopeptidase